MTSPEGLAAWFPFDVVGERAAGAPLRFVFREGEGEPFAGSMVEFSPPSVMELRWEGDETLRLELREAGAGCELTLINRFDEIGKAARDAAGWHACLDVLEASLVGRVGRRGRALGRGAPGLRGALRPGGLDDRPAGLNARERRVCRARSTNSTLADA